MQFDCCGAGNASLDFMEPHDRVASSCKLLHYTDVSNKTNVTMLQLRLTVAPFSSTVEKYHGGWI